MQEEQINKMSNDVKNFLAKKSETKLKINQLEDRISKMQNYFSRPNVDVDSNSEQKTAFSNFIRKGIVDGLITKGFSGDSNEAGVLITPEMSKVIISNVRAKSPMRQLASIESISTRALDVILEDGKLSSGWVAEASERKDTATSKLVKKTIHAHEIYAQPKATSAIINDSEINMDNWLVERISDSFVRLENEAFIKGDGSNKPFGILENKKVETLDVGNKISVEMLLGLINKLEESYLANASFLMNRNTLSAIQSLRDDTGRFIWQQSLSDPLKQTIFGIPVFISSDMPDIAKDSKSIALGDFRSAYKIVDRSGINLMRDPYTEKPFIKFYSVKRVGGDVVNPEAMKFAKFSA